MLLLAHPTGNQNTRHALKALQEVGLLGEFVTTVATFDGNVFDRFSKTKLGAEFERRRYQQDLLNITRQQPWWELARLIAPRLGLHYFVLHERGLFCVDSVYRRLDRLAASRVKKLAEAGRLSAVYAYEDGALETFRKAKEFGLKCIYDLPIAYWRTARRLLEEEAERWPEWMPTLSGTQDSEEKCARKEAEVELADVIICPSGFVRDSLSEAPCNGKPIHVIPFGSPAVGGQEIEERTRKNQRLRVLFAGSMTQRKGLADVFEAMKLLDSSHFELHVLGRPIVEMSFYRRQFSNFSYHHTRPHSEVLKLMRSCDVFVLPSIVEGRALVQQEALASGLPIIVTKNAGAEDLVIDEQAGFLVPIRNPQAIAMKLELLHRDRDRLLAMKEAALAKAEQLTWETYRRGLVEAVKPRESRRREHSAWDLALQQRV